MAKYRYLYCEFWTDPGVLDFTPEEKFFYIYLLTNRYTSQCGIYEISTKQIEFEIGYNNETVGKLLERFEKCYEKIKYNPKTRELAIKNWTKYNKCTSPKVQICLDNELQKIKDRSMIEYVYGIDTLSIQDHKEKEKQKEEPKEAEEQEDDTKKDPKVIVEDYSSSEELEVQQSKDDASHATNFSPEQEKAIFEAYEKYIGKPNKATEVKLKQLAETKDSRTIINAILEAKCYGVKNIGYIIAILNRWDKSGVPKPKESTKNICNGPNTDKSGGSLDEFITR